MSENHDNIQPDEKDTKKSSDIPNGARSSDEAPDMRERFASPAERVLAEMERLMNGDTSEDAQPQSKESHLSDDVKLYADKMGRNHVIDEIQAQGIFYVRPSTAFLVVLNIIVVPISGAAAFRIFYYLTFIFKFVIPEAFWIVLKVLNFAAAAAVMFLVFLYCVKKTRGTLHSYKADGRGFYVTVKGKGKDQILYRDVLGVDLTPTKFLWFDRGYKVDIVMTYGVVHYDYIFPYFGHSIFPGDLPFDVIARNIPNRDHTDRQ